MTAITVPEAVEALTAAASALSAERASRDPHWLQALRKEALERFGDRGIPGSRAVSETAWRPAAGEGVATLRSRPAPFEAFLRLAPVVTATRRSRQLVLVNGRVDADLSALDGRVPGIRFESISRLLATDPQRLHPHLGLTGSHRRHPFAALNTAFLADGACLVVDAGVVAPEPFHVVHVTDPAEGPVASHPRLLVVLGENAQASVVESFVGEDGGGKALVNAVTEIYLGPHATLDHTKLQEEGTGTVHRGALWSHQDRGSQLFSHVFSLGGADVVNELNVALHGQGAGATLDGLFMAKGTQQVANRTLIDHARPNCGSQEYFKGIVDGKSHGSFDGKVVVRPHAVKTDAHQRSRNLVLSREALVDARPELEIYNNDVKCTHAATTGRLDDAAVFYLRSRGLSEGDSRALLTAAFAAEIVGRTKVAAVREYLEARVRVWLAGEGA